MHTYSMWLWHSAQWNLNLHQWLKLHKLVHIGLFVSRSEREMLWFGQHICRTEEWLHQYFIILKTLLKPQRCDSGVYFIRWGKEIQTISLVTPQPSFPWESGGRDNVEYCQNGTTVCCCIEKLLWLFIFKSTITYLLNTLKHQCDIERTK